MCNNYEFYLMLGTSSLFLYSELMPFLKKHKGNGLFHALFLILNSECIKIKKEEENDEENIV